MANGNLETLWAVGTPSPGVREGAREGAGTPG